VFDMQPVIQEDRSGCGIAASVAIAGVSYRETRDVASRLGIHAKDASLWSDTAYVRSLLLKLGFQTDDKEMPFTNWIALSDLALLSIKWHSENERPFWHWVVFIRDGEDSYVLDSSKALKNNIRTDFGRMKPKCYIGVKKQGT
jgi:hypothetical protein